MMQFAKEPVCKTTDVCKLERFRSESGMYAVIHVVSLLGLRNRWLAVSTGFEGEYVISRHGTMRRAKEACTKWARRKVR